MLQDEKETQTAKAADDDLEPYRRLIELQKQMIGLVQQHEKTKHECAALRAQLVDEMTNPRRQRWNLRRLISRPAAGWLKNLANSSKPRVKSRPQPNGSLLPRNRFFET
jgi:hypothetical protein